MFQSTALCLEVGCQGNADQEGRRKEKRALLYSPEHPGWKLWLVAGHLPEPHSLQCLCKVIACQSQGLRRMEADSLSSFPDAYSLSIVAKCLLLLLWPAPTYLWNSSTSSAYWNYFIKGWEEGNRPEASVGYLGTLRTSLFVFSYPCSFQAF